MTQKYIKDRVEHAGITLRLPIIEDGLKVHELIERCPPLDPNSSYCNFLQCIHFPNTSVAAEKDGELVGFISGYLQPTKPDTLFIWQVAVNENVRGCGLASAMLNFIVSNQPPDVTYLETTITESNQASWALFKRFAEKSSSNVEESIFIDRSKHFNNEHDTEMLVRIGPFNQQ